MIQSSLQTYNFVNKVELAKVIDGIFIGGLIERDGQYRFLLVEFLSDAHRAILILCLPSSVPDWPMTPGRSSLKIMTTAPCGVISTLKPSISMIRSNCLAEDRAGDGAGNFVGNDLCGEAGRDVFGRRVFGYVDADASFFGEHGGIDHIERHFEMFLEQADGEVERYGLDEAFRRFCRDTRPGPA